MRSLRTWLAAAFLSLAPLVVGLVTAHEMSIAELEARETSPGEWLWIWAATNDQRPSMENIKVHWPESCTVEPNALHCGDRGLKGTFTIDGVGKFYSAVLFKVYWLDNQKRVYTLTGSQPTVQLFGSADDHRGIGEIAKAYTVLGFEHILSGFDHLMFVIALLFLVGFNRRLLWTITAFTAAHSLTLALSALGWLTLRPPPVEATIALSIMLVAAEAMHKQQTLSRRWPAVVAFLFGLVHGLGFAGALKEIGLPQNNLFAALLTFNVGVELGQLFVIALAYVGYRALSRMPKFDMARLPALYAIGSVAAYWSIGRIVAILA
jgi:hydrogenase/urease accessory protein HupE